MKAIDLFCGAGGLTHGLTRAGWNVVAGIDIDQSVEATYVLNNPSVKFICADVRRVEGDELLSLLSQTSGEDFLLAGCAPCQAFSKQRQRSGLTKRPDSNLLLEYARLVKELRPSAILMENVPGVASDLGNDSIDFLKNTLLSSGYEFDFGVLNAREFGVPQHRRRYVLLGLREGELRLPTIYENYATTDTFTVRQAIDRFPQVDAGETHLSVPNHRAAGLSPLNLQRIRATPHDGGSRRGWPEELRLGCHSHDGIGFSDVYGRMWWDRVAPTLTSRCNSLSNGRFGHPEQDRAISLREAAALQSFPDDYEFYGPSNRIAQWIGNAVPVRLAQVLGEAVMAAAA